jgi:SAM-dependent methyltransferase
MWRRSNIDRVPIADINQAAYSKRDLVWNYAAKQRLFVPEEPVKTWLQARAGQVRMLDVGVGAGRTTRHFAALTKGYVGLDYVHAMTCASSSKFAGRPGLYFVTADARWLPVTSDSFDLVMFSFNGLDNVDERDRVEVLREARRVCKPGGTFCFSSHNILSIPTLLSVTWNDLVLSPAESARRLVLRVVFRLLNPPVGELLGRSSAVINNGVHFFRLRTCYVRPAAQLRQLEEVGFSRVTVLGMDGRRIAHGAELACVTDSWLYYFCEKKDGAGSNTSLVSQLTSTSP